MKPSHLRLLASAAIVLLAWAVYQPVRHHEFIHYDDRLLIVENPALDAGLTPEGVAWAFGTTRDGNWIPLTWITFLADESWFERSPAGTHLFSLLLHILAAVTLLLALHRLTGALGASAFTAAVYALHPLHVESVAWAAERKDVLSGLFFATTLLAYARYAERPSVSRYVPVLLAFTLGLLSKAMLVTVPFVLLLLDFWPLGRTAPGPREDGRWALAPRRVGVLVLEKLPLLALSVAASAVTYWAQSGRGATRAIQSWPLGLRVENALVSAVAYLRKALWPSDLAIFYPFPADGFPLGQVAAAAALLAAVSAWAVWQRTARPYWLVGWLWYLGMLVPVIGLVQVGTQRMADRYTYLPLVGASLALAFAGAEWAKRSRSARIAVSAAALVAVVAMSLVSSAQLRHWRDARAVFERALAVTEQNAVAHNGLAVALLEGEPEPQELEAAIAELGRAIEIAPAMIDAHVNLGVALLRVGDPLSAIPHLERGLAVPDAYRVPTVHTALGWARVQGGDSARATAHFRSALGHEPDRVEALVGLGHALLGVGRPMEAKRPLERARSLGGDRYELHWGLARVFEQEGRGPEAVAAYRRALAARPGSAEVANNLAWLLATHPDPSVRDPSEAVRVAESIPAAVREQSAAILDTLALSYAAAGRLEEGRATGRRAVGLARAAGDLELAREIEGRWAELGGAP